MQTPAKLAARKTTLMVRLRDVGARLEGNNFSFGVTDAGPDFSIWVLDGESTRVPFTDHRPMSQVTDMLTHAEVWVAKVEAEQAR